jgi:hypothetical protein
MKLKIRMDKESFVNNVTADDLVDEDDLTFSTHEGILMVKASAAVIAECLRELGNCFDQAELATLIVE